MIYFAKMKNLNVIKIGFTARADVSARIKELNRRYDSDIEVIAICAGQTEHKVRLHRMFSEFRVTGELFRPHESIIAYALSSQQKYPVGGLNGFAGDDMIANQEIAA